MKRPSLSLYAAALALVLQIDSHLTGGNFCRLSTHHYWSKSGVLLDTLDQVVNAILEDNLLQGEPKMRVPDHIEKYRIRKGPLRSDSTFGCNGAFKLQQTKKSSLLKVIISDGENWEHASISVDGNERCPTWEEMCYVKDVFWALEDVVIQYHPADSEYVNCHPFTLHLWRPVGVVVPTPPGILVGPIETD